MGAAVLCAVGVVVLASCFPIVFLQCTSSADCNGAQCDVNPPPEPNICICEDEFAGPFCGDEQMERRCGMVMGSCANGGTCVSNGKGGYICDCPSGYTGKQCQIEVEEAMCYAHSECFNKGRCGPDNLCDCLEGFKGIFCEIACMDEDDCNNNGRCELKDRPRCICDDGYSGAKCGIGPGVDTTIIIVVVVVCVVLIVLIALVAVLLVRRRNKRRSHSDPGLTGLEMGAKSKQKNDYIGVGSESPSTKVANFVQNQEQPEGMSFPREYLHMMEQLGTGSFAVVHKAEAEGIIKKGIVSTVAVKMLKATATESDKSDFEKERHMYLNLGTHPNVVTMYGYCIEKEPFFLIMEYLLNGNLQTYLRHVRMGFQEKYDSQEKNVDGQKRQALQPGEILSFASQVANGMQFLSSKSCIHRDLATRNILLGEDLVAKVSDFGLARDIQDQSQYEMKSKGRVPVRWMAPESLLDNIYTSKSDVWGFAVLLWELVTLGSHPYPGMSSRQVVEEIKSGYRLPKPEHCSNEIYEMMRNCWREFPEDRPSFVEICRILDEMLMNANGYLIMADLKSEDYLYLEPSQMTKSINTADE